MGQTRERRQIAIDAISIFAAKNQCLHNTPISGIGPNLARSRLACRHVPSCRLQLELVPPRSNTPRDVAREIDSFAPVPNGEMVFIPDAVMSRESRSHHLARDPPWLAGSLSTTPVGGGPQSDLLPTRAHVDMWRQAESSSIASCAARSSPTCRCRRRKCIRRSSIQHRQGGRRGCARPCARAHDEVIN